MLFHVNVSSTYALEIAAENNRLVRNYQLDSIIKKNIVYCVCFLIALRNYLLVDSRKILF